VLYVSLSESKDQLLADLGHRDQESARLAQDKRFRFLDLLPMKGDAIAFATQSILSAVNKYDVKRLVIDSYTAMALGFENGQEARSFLQAVLHNIVRLQGCTTLLISEESKTGSDADFSPEQFAADVVLRLGSTTPQGRLIRTIEITKARGTRLVERRLLYSLEGGFVIFSPHKAPPSTVPGNPPKVVPRGGKFSTGIPDLDALLGGGLGRGEGLLLSTDSTVANQERELFTGNAITSFLSAGHAVAVVPPLGEGVIGMDRYVGSSRGRESWNDRLALFYPEYLIPQGVQLPKPIVGLSTKSPDGSFDGFYKKQRDISGNGKIQMLTVISIDQLYAMFGESMVSTMTRGVSGMRSTGGVAVSTLKPGLPSQYLYEEIRSLSDYHFELTKHEGVLVMYGIRPSTNAFVVEFDESPQRPIPRLHLID
jgi:KaiC/GvpD/RAD55 family RecA-like ATPase